MAEMLDLSIHSSVEFEHAVLTHNADISCFVNKLIVRLVQRILNKRSRRPLGVVVITERKYRTADANFALLALLRCRTVLIDEENTVVLIGQAYRQNSIIRRFFRNNMIGARGCRFRRAVLVDKERIGQILLPLLQAFSRHNRAGETNLFEIFRSAVLKSTQ